MIRFFDASALVKRYVREAETAYVTNLLLESLPFPAVSRTSEAEIASALARRRREGDLTPRAYSAAQAMLRDDFARLHVVELTRRVVSGVHPLLARHPLRAGDALQLAAALALRGGLAVEVELVSFDERLNEAARAEGFRVLP